MKKTKLILFMVLGLTTISLVNSGCSKVEGCTNSAADNYDPEADEDDGSCTCSSTLLFDNYDGEDYTIVSSTGNTWVISEWGTKEINITEVGDCHSYSIYNAYGTGSQTLKGTTSQCACDDDKTVRLDYI